MNLWWATTLVLLSSLVAAGILLLIRRWSPHGGHFGDTGRATGVFTILGTTFAVLFAFIVLLAFTAYDKTRTGGETEATTVTQQFETAQLLPAPAGARLSSQLVCYARAVVHQEWPEMEAGSAPTFNPWGVPMFLTTKSMRPSTAVQQAAYSEWLSETTQRELARQDRVHGAEGLIPEPLWFVFLVSAGIVLGFVFFFADRSEGAVVQAVQVGAVTAMLVAAVLVVVFLDHPYHPGSGSIDPTAMRTTLVQTDLATRTLHLHLPTLCDANGRAVNGSPGG